jgi:anti-sigma factor RsiW
MKDTTDIRCTYSGDRDEVLVAYLYDDIEPASRASFDAHLAACGRCRDELADLRSVRSQLGKWAPPEPAFASSHRLPATSHQPPVTSRWRAIPAWAQVAAALLFLGVAAGIANLDVRYDNDGLTVRTGWSKNSVAKTAADVGLKSDATRSGQATPVSTAASAPWRADLAALEQQLRRELRASVVPGAARPMKASAVGVSEVEILRRVRTMLDESARQQQTELALRLAGVMRDVNAQRNADLVRINQNLGLFQQDMGVAVLQNKRKVDYLVERVSHIK